MPFKFLIFLTLLFVPPVNAGAETVSSECPADNTKCLFAEAEAIIKSIEESRWRDRSYRELAKFMAEEGQYEKAMSIIDLIETPDTKAMTIRGIGMAHAGRTNNDLDADESIFTRLRAEAEKISDPPAYAIALTYIAMSQAFAGDNDGAMKTAADMENSALRNKAYAEAAEIQAEKNDPAAAMESISAIDDQAFRDKAHRLISKIFADRNEFESALSAARKIEETYNRSQAILYILARQTNPEEVNRLD